MNFEKQEETQEITTAQEINPIPVLSYLPELIKEDIEKFLNNFFGAKDNSFKATVTRLRSFGNGRHQVDVTAETSTTKKNINIKVIGELNAINVIRTVLKP